MAGRGSRLRPHTLTIPKPLMPVAGKPIVHRLVEDITKVSNEKVDEIAFIIGDFGDETEKQLLEIAESLNVPIWDLYDIVKKLENLSLINTKT